MSDEETTSNFSTEPELVTTVSSLQELLDRVSGRSYRTDQPQEDAGLAEAIPFPFLALLGQREMKLALLLSLVNPRLGGVLLIGPRGTGKTTAVRSVVDLLPSVRQSLCYYGCLENDIETGGIDAVCQNCAEKYGRGEPLSKLASVRLVELPLNARLEDVVGGLDPRAEIKERMRLKRGILSHADRNLLYVDEVNMLADPVVDAILDAAAQGQYTVRRGVVAATYRSDFTLIGSMNPEEGLLRPQIMDRFGLRVIVRGLKEKEDRLAAYLRARAYKNNRRGFVQQFDEETQTLREEIQLGRNALAEVRLPKKVTNAGLELIQKLEIASLRAEITLFEAARAYAVADARLEVTIQDLRAVAPMALRLRRSQFISDYLNGQVEEDRKLAQVLDEILPDDG
ncbi:MAG: magnesium chelatase [Chloroflexota bacterium]|nr:MAG: magnesium chelatase [Chloroflexota bacterium]